MAVTVLLHLIAHSSSLTSQHPSPCPLCCSPTGFLPDLQIHWKPASGFPGGSEGKESTCNARDLGSIPGSGRSPGGGYGNPLEYSCLENPHGQRSLVDYSPWGCKELDMTEVTWHAHTCVCIAHSLCCTVETNTTL